MATGIRVPLGSVLKKGGAGLLEEARYEALRLLHKKRIKILDFVEVKQVYLETSSWCSGYDPEERIEICVQARRIWLTSVSSMLEDMDEFLVHEYGHAFLFKVWKSLTKKEKMKFTELFGDYDSDGEEYANLTGDTLRSMFGMAEREFDEKMFVSLYASTSPHEDWAETFAYYVCDEISKKAPLLILEKVAFLKLLIERYGRKRRLLLYRT